MKQCLVCSKILVRPSKEAHKQFKNKKYCSRYCCDAWKKGKIMPPSRKGAVPWNKGKDNRPDCLDCGKKCSYNSKKKYCRKCFSGEKRHNYKGGIPNCINCKKKLGRRDAKYCRTCAGKLLRSGSKSYSWKGGITPLVGKIRSCVEYKLWRTSIFKRDNYTCVLCKIKSGNGKTIILHADHSPKMFKEIFQEYNIKSYKEAVCCREFWDITNGRTLCRECHKIETKKQWKK